MKSPFAIFRKHSKELLVALTFLAMFAFIILDQLRPEQTPAVMGVVLGAMLFWFLGRDRNQSTKLAIGGAILGGLLATFAMGSPAGAVVVDTSVGSLTETELRDLVLRRRMANRFMQEAYFAARGDDETARPPRDLIFAFDPNQPLVDDVLLGFLLDHEADRLGIEVSDEAVTTHINQMTENKLSVANFKRIRSEMQISDQKLYDIIREQLRARMAFLLTIPRDVLPPEEYWEMYQKLHVQVQLEAVPVPVEDFTTSLPEPSQGELQAFFDQFKTVFPDQMAPGAPGFRQPRKVQLAYIEADYAALESAVPPVTDAEVEAYYAANKELYRNRTLPDGTEGPSFSSPLEGLMPPKTEVPPGEKSEGEESAKPDTKPDTQSDTDQESDAANAKKPETKPAPASKADSESKAKSETQPESEAKPASEPKSEPKDDNADQGKTDKKDAPESSEDSGAAFSVSDPAPEKTDATADKSEPAKSEPAKSETTKTESSAEQEKPAAPAKTADSDKPAEAADKASTTEPKPATESSPPAPALPEPAGKAGDKPATGSEEKPPAEPLPEFRPLDDELRGEIRDQLLRTRTLAEMQRRIDTTVEKMTDLAYRVNAPADAEENQSAEEVAEQLRKFTEANSLRYVQTGLMSARELSESEDHPIGQATEPVTNPFEQQNSRSVIMALFETDQVYIPYQAEDPLTGNRFAYWKTAEVADRVPELDDPGVREQVLAAWRTEQARPLASKRAEELVKELQTTPAETDWTAAVADKTVTGNKEPADPLVVQSTESFSWMRTSSAPSNNPFSIPEPVLSTLSIEPNPGEEFMRTVFDQLKVGEVGMAPNADRSIFYVVRVKNRVPSSEVAIDQLRKSFLQENLFFFSPYAILAQREQGQLGMRWSRDLLARYNVQRNEPLEEVAP